MLCPHCKVPLAIADRQGVEIDYCPQCRGVWLDRGELDKILERSAQPYSAPPPVHQPPPQRPGQWEHHDRDRHHDHYKHKRRKSFLEEVFDF